LYYANPGFIPNAPSKLAAEFNIRSPQSIDRILEQLDFLGNFSGLESGSHVAAAAAN
jgi:hypothetical protein